MYFGRSATGRLAAIALLSALALPACSFFRDLEDVDLNFNPDDGDADGGVDGGDGGGPDVDGGDAGEVIELPDASRFGDPDRNVCNRFDKRCIDAFYCSLSFNEPGYQLTCRPNDNAGVGAEGEACERLLGDCQAGLDCIDWPAIEGVADPRGKVCTPPCLIGADQGCAPGDGCMHVFEEIQGIGYCFPGCDPYADDCESGQCSIDPSYPERSLLPRFRCLEHGGAAQKSVGSSCDPVLTTQSGCPSGLICYEIDPDASRFQCVQPCQADGDCDAGSCQEPQGEFGLRYCSMG